MYLGTKIISSFPMLIGHRVSSSVNCLLLFFERLSRELSFLIGLLIHLHLNPTS